MQFFADYAEKLTNKKSITRKKLLSNGKIRFMKIAVLGGSYNPPHLGHLLIAKQILKYNIVDEIWLTPCYRHTFLKDLAPAKNRVTMTKMLTNKKIKYCSEEIDNKLSGETIELMELLGKKYPQHQFVFIIGSDNLAGLKKWGQWEKLISNYKFLIFKRPGFSTNLDYYGLNNPNYRLQTIKHRRLTVLDVSSTAVREAIKKNLPLNRLVPKKVDKYIKKNNLYR